MTSTSSNCDGCGLPPRGITKLSICSRCQKAWYHDAVCQRQHYSEHKSMCRKTASALRLLSKVNVPDEFTDGLLVVDSGGVLGKVAIATSDFSPGSGTVLLEPPAIVFNEDDGYSGLFDAFLEAPSETKQGILKMHYSPILTQTDPSQLEKRNTEMLRDGFVEDELGRYALGKPSSAQDLTVELAKKLVRIVGCNAHSFDTTPIGDLIANGSSSELPGQSSALFVLGSKAEHSCAPNLTFCIDRGMLRYTAEIPISSGDRLSISYSGSVLQRARKKRREFLQENKAFFCMCARCLGPDECSPLRCDKCKSGVIFQVGSEKKWFCVSSCSWDVSNVSGINAQQRTESDFTKRIAVLRDSLQHGIDGYTLTSAMTAQADVAEEFHPLHWHHVAAWDLVSIVSSSLARILMMQGQPPTAPQVACMLRLSATCQIQQTLWTARNAAIVYGHLKLKDAVAGIEKNGTHRLRVCFSNDTTEVSSLLDLLCDPQQKTQYDCTQVTKDVFHAGQDLLLAGHARLAARLYARYQATILVSHSIMSDENKDNFRVFMKSGGKENHFKNHLLAV